MVKWKLHLALVYEFNESVGLYVETLLDAQHFICLICTFICLPIFFFFFFFILQIFWEDRYILYIFFLLSKKIFWQKKNLNDKSVQGCFGCIKSTRIHWGRYNSTTFDSVYVVRLRPFKYIEYYIKTATKIQKSHICSQDEAVPPFFRMPEDQTARYYMYVYKQTHISSSPELQDTSSTLRAHADESASEPADG